jgi:branched-chain amino acid transport system substrate-binding protein
MLRARKSLGVIAAVSTLVALAPACSSSKNDNGGGGGSGSSGALKIGYILPETGDLAKAGLGAPQIAATKYAIKVINDAGGVNGKKIPNPPGQDETGDAAKATVNVGNLLSQNVNAIIGAAASGMTLAIIDKVVQAGVVECSGSNTAPTLTDYKDNGYYFRTAPSDALQGPVLGGLVVKNGGKNVVVAARADDYGRGLQKATVDAIKKAGGNVVDQPTYDPSATNFDALVSGIVAKKPDSIVLVSFGEAAQILKGLIEAGMGPNKVKIYGADGERSEELPAQVDPSNPKVLDGMMGTAPASSENDKFINDLKAFDPSLKTEQYAPQVFDCVMTIALAAEAAKSNNPAKIKDQMAAVTNGDEKCSTFADCKKALDDGKSISYQGASGPLNLDSNGEPATASIEVWKFDNGKLSTVTTVESKK